MGLVALWMLVVPLVSVGLAVRHVNRLHAAQRARGETPSSLSGALTVVAAIVFGLLLAAGGCTAYFRIFGLRLH